MAELDELRRMMEEDIEKDEEAKGKAVDLFERSDLLASADKVYVTEIPELGGYVKFCKLTYAESREISRTVKDADERNIAIIAKMIEKANPRLKDVRGRLDSLPVDVVGLVSGRMNEASFLRTPKR